MLFFSLNFVHFRERSDAIFSNLEEPPKIYSSGSFGLFNSDSNCYPTFPNFTINSNRKFDWCSNIALGSEYPWISFNIPQKSMKISGFSLRNGCCFQGDNCCNPQTKKKLNINCCSSLYSYSIQGSNDNRKWITIHRVERDNNIQWCQTKTYEFEMSEPFNYIRFQMDEEKDGSPKCLQINQIELYGKITPQRFSSFSDDESISIIGKIAY